MIADRLAALLGTGVEAVRDLGADHEWTLHRATLRDGRDVFVKAVTARAVRSEPHDTHDGGDGPDVRDPLDGVFAAEAAGLRWLREAGAAPVPQVVAADARTLVLSWLDAEPPTVAAAERFGRELAALHRAGAPAFGAGWPGFIAELPLDNTRGADWPSWYAERRLAPFLRAAADQGSLAPDDVRLMERVIDRIGGLAGPPEAPSRIHGDLWSGNVMWAGGRGWLIDPAAHGGHRETDLAMLSLFGAPYLDRILAAYDESAPLADGWRARVPLHRLHPLLVHVVLFGGTYRASLVAAAREALRA